MEAEKERGISMKVNYNMSAVITNSQLLRTEGNLTVAMEKLSSGIRINHAKDDAAGMAISNKMRLQIDGLDQASQNASNGTSVLQTADGALNEVTSIIQRMRELAVQAANDTNVESDRKAIQSEIASLREEVNRVSKDTEFNTKPLLNGTLDNRVYAKNISRMDVSIYVDPGMYEVDVTTAAEKANLTADSAQFADMTGYVGASGRMKINGYVIDIEESDTMEEVYQKLREGAEFGEAEADILDDGTLSLTSAFYGEKGVVKVEFENTQLASALGFASTEPNIVFGEDAQIVLGDGFSDTATTSVDGNKVVITDKSGFEIAFMVDENYPAAGATNTTVQIEVTEIGSMTLQIGANEDQTMEVRIPEISAETLYLDEVDVTTVNGASRAIDRMDTALDKLMGVRSSLGAFENRLDYAVQALDETNENMTAALSRIEDVDMAEEMSNYTQQNVLEQAAISVLSQANDLPQQTLQLLQ